MGDLAEKGVDIITMDVTSHESVQAAVQKVIDQAGHVDILVNNAGMSGTAPLVDMPLERTKQIYETNVIGPLRVAQAVTPHMIKAGRGLIINVTSVVADMPMVFGGVYASSKSALRSLTTVLRTELSPFNIRVMELVPGAIISKIADNQEGVWDPNGSAYKSVGNGIAARQRISQGSYATPTAEFAKAVVQKALLANPPTYFACGAKTWLVWFVKTFIPSWVVQWVLAGQYGLRRLGKERAARK